MRDVSAVLHSVSATIDAVVFVIILTVLEFTVTQTTELPFVRASSTTPYFPLLHSKINFTYLNRN